MGIYLCEGNEAILIDSGLDKDSGKKILKLLESRGFSLKFIINTHSNADHTGGNRF
jgi:glyoxylase-like metal-dependent hydrolase (beta-lactamase superfamily II)